MKNLWSLLMNLLTWHVTEKIWCVWGHFNNASNQHRKRLSSFKTSLTSPWNLTLIIIWSSPVAKMSTVCWCASEVWRNGTSSHSRTDSDDHSAFYFLQLNKEHKTYPTSQRPLLLQHKTQWESKEGVKERDPEAEWTKNDTDATVINLEFTLITSIWLVWLGGCLSLLVEITFWGHKERTKRAL